MIGFAILLTVMSVMADDKQYTTKYDNVDLHEIIKNERLLKNYVDCLMEKRQCTPDGVELKQNMPDAIQTGCSKCSDKQKEGSEIIINYLIDNKPDYWEELEKKYDPSGSYRKMYLESKTETTTTEPLTS